jgi:hydroxymethylpyrimidine/phosphomethylpyrimidine kinase
VFLQISGAGESAAGKATPSGDPAEKHDSDAPAIDVLYDGHEIHVLESKRVHTHNTHGTGELYPLCLLCLLC